MTDQQQSREWLGKNKGMSPDEIREFLAGAVVARVATIDADGLPYITPVWQEWDGEALWLVPREKTAFVQHLKKNPNVAVSCAMDSGTYKRVLFRGKAEIVSGPAPMAGQCLEVAQRMSVRYLGEHGPEYLVPTMDRPRYLIKVVPTTTISWDGVEWAEKYKPHA
ncbi:MAG: pyridoxamine 5'-phosphate oxidase family protein [Anaerolineae bacterium]|nr:pyridoxamine 5'-phosphate oxidase family protein [Anaerolineae bacterium]